MKEEEHNKHNALAEQQIIEDVKNFGWSIGLFEATETEPSFAYTIGLWKSYGHPEIISFGLDPVNLGRILNNTGQLIKAGKIIIDNQDNHEIFENAPAQFLTVDKERIREYFGYCMWFNDYKEFPAMQLVWTDKEGNFQWQKDFNRKLDSMQPILNDDILQRIKSVRS